MKLFYLLDLYWRVGMAYIRLIKKTSLHIQKLPWKIFPFEKLYFTTSDNFALFHGLQGTLVFNFPTKISEAYNKDVASLLLTHPVIQLCYTIPPILKSKHTWKVEEFSWGGF